MMGRRILLLIGCSLAGLAKADDAQVEALRAFAAGDYRYCLTVSGYLERRPESQAVGLALQALSLHELKEDEALVLQVLERYAALGRRAPQHSSVVSLLASYRQKEKVAKQREKEKARQEEAEQQKEARQELQRLAIASARPMDDAVQAYEESQYTKALGYLATLELQRGPSPRAESLRALVLHEMGGRDEETFKSLERYAEMTRGNATLAGDDNHKDLLELLEEYRKRILAQKNRALSEQTKRRDEVAKRAEASSHSAIERQRQAAQTRLEDAVASLPAEKLAALTPRDYAFVRSAGSDPLAGRIDQKIFQVEKLLLSGPFQLGMDIDRLRKEVQQRVGAFNHESGVVQRFTERYEFPADKLVVGFSIPIRHSARDHHVIDRAAFFERVLAWDDFSHDRDWPAFLQLCDAVGNANLKPFLGVPGEQWKLVQATTDPESQTISSLSFASALGEQGEAEEILRRLQNAFGPFHRAGTAEMITRYQARDNLVGARFAFPPINHRLVTGRVFRTKENLVKGPWIVELRVDRLLTSSGQALDSTVQQLAETAPAVALQAGDFQPLGRRFAEALLRRNMQKANGLKVTRNDRQYTLVTGPEAFTFESGADRTAGFSFALKDAATGRIEQIELARLDLSRVTTVETSYRYDSGAAREYNVQLVGSAGQPTTLTVYTDDSFANGVHEAIIASLPDPSVLSADDFSRLANLFAHADERHRLGDALLPIFQTADRQRKLTSIYPLVRLAPPEERPKYYLRAANEGDAHAMDALREHYEKKWREKSGTERDRAEMLKWANRAADAGQPSSLRYLLEEEIDRDFVGAERWLNKARELKIEVDPDVARKIMQRAEAVRAFSQLTFEQKLKEFRPMLENSAVGQKFKQYATPDKGFTQVEKYKSDRSGKTVTVYRRGEAINNGPQLVYVNRRGMIIGEYYLLGGRYKYASRYRDEVAYLVQLLGQEHLEDIRHTATNLREAIRVRYNRFKTIELLMFAERASYLKIIDHSAE